MYSLGTRIADAAQKVGGLDALSKLTGIKKRTLYDYVRGSTEPKVSSLVNIAQHTGVGTAWLAEGSQESTSDDVDVSNHSSFAFVPRLDVAVSAGNGSIAVSEDAQGTLAFRADWLRERGINPKMASALAVTGDSMEPTIRDGDILLVDRSIDYVKDNGIYVVVIGGMLVVKRVHTALDGSVTLMSENSAYPPETVSAGETADLILAGRVMWFGRSI